MRLDRTQIDHVPTDSALRLGLDDSIAALGVADRLAGRARPAWVDTDGADSLVAGRRIRSARRTLGGTATDRLGQGHVKEAHLLIDAWFMRTSLFALAQPARTDHRAGVTGYGIASAPPEPVPKRRERKRKYGQRIDAALLDTLPMKEMYLTLYGKTQSPGALGHSGDSVSEGALVRAVWCEVKVDDAT